MIKLTLPDGSKLEVEKGTMAVDAAKKISERLAKAALIAKVDEKLVDLSEKLEKDCSFEVKTFESKEGVETFRHSSSHIMALAVKRLFPGAKFAIGPAIEEGFYYDFDVEQAFTPQDLQKIEAEIRKIVAQDLPFQRKVVSKQEALKMFKDQSYKVELIKELKDEEISIYTVGEFTDFCRGPHVPSSGVLKAFKLLKVAGAYWRGDASKKMLQRIYGISFPSQRELDEWVRVREEAEKRDHRKLGPQLDLFSFNDEAPGMAFWHPKGTVLWNILVDFWRQEHLKEGYVEIRTPLILNQKLWVQSGHWDHYKDNMYFTKIDEVDYAVKPMNCPGGMLVYKRRAWSYRDLPMRVGELGLVHRHELSGVLSGLLRVRCFTQDDAHIFMTEDQMMDEITKLLKLIDRFYKIFGLDYQVELSTRPEKAMGSKETWDRAERILQDAMRKVGKKFDINPGEGAFYGPKLDFKVKDCIGRTWQCGTVQLDYQMPERFELEYAAEDGSKKRPVMLHRVVYGALERFIAVLIEHYAGRFPLWLSPVQVRVMNLTDRNKDYAREIFEKLMAAGIRAEIDDSQNTLQYKIREAQLQQINYMVIAGDKEEEKKKISVRSRENKVSNDLDFDKFLADLKKEIDTKYWAGCQVKAPKK